MNKNLCIVICLFIGFLIFKLLKSYCSCDIIEGRYTKAKQIGAGSSQECTTIIKKDQGAKPCKLYYDCQSAIDNQSPNGSIDDLCAMDPVYGGPRPGWRTKEWHKDDVDAAVNVLYNGFNQGTLESRCCQNTCRSLYETVGDANTPLYVCPDPQVPNHEKWSEPVELPTDGDNDAAADVIEENNIQKCCSDPQGTCQQIERSGHTNLNDSKQDYYRCFDGDGNYDIDHAPKCNSYNSLGMCTGDNQKNADNFGGVCCEWIPKEGSDQGEKITYLNRESDWKDLNFSEPTI